MIIFWVGMTLLGVNALLAIVGIYYSVLRKHQMERGRGGITRTVTTSQRNGYPRR